ETARDVDPVAVTGQVQEALRVAGEDDPRVEVYATDEDLPGYQSAARGRGALLWSASPDRPVRMARLYDSVDPTEGPAMSADHPVAEGDEVPQLVGYLLTGRMLVQ